MLQKIKEAHANKFKDKVLYVKAPSRVNLIGEHTDYNLGFSLPAAVNLAMYFAMNENNEQFINLQAYNLQQSVSFENGDRSYPQGHWIGLFKTVLIELEARGFKVNGIDCTFGGDIPIGAGMSSSSALNCGFIFSLSQIYNWKLSAKDIMLIAQAAEHRFGVKGGLMDQYTILNGKKNHALLLDFLQMKHQFIPLNMGDFRFVLFNTCVKHSLVDSPYNQRRKSCENALEIIKEKHAEIHSYQDLTEDILLEFKSEIALEDFRKARYVIKENKRVLEAAVALKTSDWEGFGQLLFESHQGLREEYEVSCPELDFIVDTVRGQAGVLGSRMMGGGFGGCTINLIHKDKIESVWEYLSKAYFDEFQIQAEIYEVEVGGGIHECGNGKVEK